MRNDVGIWMAFGMSIGLMLGAGVGLWFHSLAIGTGIGLAMGAALGLAWYRARSHTSEDSEADNG